MYVICFELMCVIQCRIQFVVEGVVHCFRNESKRALCAIEWNSS